MRRRDFIRLAGGTALAWPLTARAQQLKQSSRIGFLGTDGSSADAIFVNSLREYGYVEGQNIFVERKLNAEAYLITGLVADIVHQNVDVIVANSNSWGMAAQKATSTIPIVVLASHGGVDVGLYASLAHPGGNVTGIDTVAETLDAKRIDILKQLVPQLSRLVVLYNPGFPGANAHLASVEAATRRFGLVTRLVQLRARTQVESALGEILTDRPDAILLVSDPIMFNFREQIAAFGNASGLPIATEYKLYAKTGMCLSYGPNGSALLRRGAYYVDKILKGANPGDLPVELPTEFELIINLKTAKALGLTVPSTLLATADEVIE
jgi:putative tryptophan/tyrosine transport system substrate-binding protein